MSWALNISPDLKRHRVSVRADGGRQSLVLVALFLLCGCRLLHDSQLQIVSLYDAGEATAAIQLIDNLATKRRAEQHLLTMDRAVLKLMNGQTADGVRELEILRRDLDFLCQQDVFEQIYSALKDDTAIAWSGRTFERRMVDNLQLLSGIIQNDSDIYALATRSMSEVHQKQRQAGDVYQPSSDLVPGGSKKSGESVCPEPVVSPVDRFTAYLAAAVHSERIQDSDLTDRLIQLASYRGLQPASSNEKLQRLGTRTARGSGTLQVVTLSGRVTSWVPETVLPTTSALLIADRILSAVGDHSLPATISAVQIARPVLSNASLALRTRVVVGAEHALTSEILIDVNENAWASYEADRDEQLARAVVRRSLKKGTVYTLKNSMDVSKGSRF